MRLLGHLGLSTILRPPITSSDDDPSSVVPYNAHQQRRPKLQAGSRMLARAYYLHMYSECFYSILLRPV
eukprot:scaffold590002_cov20-Prasinocladus_malaysianus.AAC.1